MAHNNHNCNPCESPCSIQEEPDCLDLLWPHLELLKSCLCLELESSVGGPVCRCAIMAGAQAAFDNCCQGTAWVIVGQTFPASTFPVPDTGLIRCDTHAMAASIEIGVVRCAPTVNDYGEPPTVEAIEESARIVHSDRVRMMKAVRCCFREALGCDEVNFGPWTAIDNQGGCVGGSMTLSVAFNTFGCDCYCDDEGRVTNAPLPAAP